MASIVYFTDMRTGYKKNLYDKLGALFTRSNIGETIREKDTVALKLHWGERGNLGFIPPTLVRYVVEKVKNFGGKPFITDTNTLYTGSRRNAVDNILTAIANGFSPEVVGAPVIVADGLCGRDFAKVKIKGTHFSEVKIASAVHHAKALISLAHFKGHEGTGFGGTLKNIGMGCGSPGGKQNMHSDVKPSVNENNCTACGSCIEVCPVDAITFTAERKSRINHKKCIGCGECVTVCNYNAIAVNWQSDLNVMQEKMVEYALGVVQEKKQKCAFFDFVMNVSPDCDCCGWTDASIVPDVGILASFDPVALDQAALDLVNEAAALPGTKLARKEAAANKFAAMYGVGGEHQLEYAEKIGLGSRKYELVRVACGGGG
ncbi:MAG: DUF362 domain-containing protein [bacterium]